LGVIGFAQAGLNEAAIKWWQKAAALAMHRSAFAEAIAHIENALDLSEALDGTKEQRLSLLRLKTSRAYTLRVARGAAASETKAAFAQASELARTIGDVPGQFAADFGLWNASVICGDLVMARGLAEAFRRDAENWSNLPEAGLIYRVQGITGYFTGDFINARLHLEHACACYDSKRDRPLADHFGQDLAVPPMALLALTLWSLGIGERARRMIEELITHAVGTRHVPSLVYAHQLAGVFEMLRRDFERSAIHLQVYLDLTREHGMRRPLAISTFYEGWMRWVAGAHERGAEYMRDGLEQIRKQGTWVFASLYAVLLAETEAAAGRSDVALAIVDAELATMVQTGQFWFLAEAHRVRGELLLKSKPADVEAAEAAFSRAIEVARGQSARRFELHAATRLAQLWADRGERVENRGLLTILADGLLD
jgi:predicted ATPase